MLHSANNAICKGNIYARIFLPLEKGIPFAKLDRYNISFIKLKMEQKYGS